MSTNRKLIIQPKFCKGCEICVKLCPKHVLELIDQKIKIKNLQDCLKCGICELYCPDYAIFLEEKYDEENNYQLMTGNEACAKGAILAGMKLFAGYPITPSSEIAEFLSGELPKIGGKFIQMEDEIAAMGAILGASLAGQKALTATSGPGFSLMQEMIGFACMAEIPSVIVNVQRGGPSTGLPTLPAQGDVMQTRWGTHGDHPAIVLCPSLVQETLELTIKAFNYAEKYRMPVILLMDEVIAHIREKVLLTKIKDIKIINRQKPLKNSDYKPYQVKEGELVPSLPDYGSGFRFHITGLVHDVNGYPTTNPEITEKLINRLTEKTDRNSKDLSLFEHYRTKDAEILLIAYGATARSAMGAVDTLRETGLKIGLFRPITIWPLIQSELKLVTQNVKKVLTVEMNLGQYSTQIERIAPKQTKTHFLGIVRGELITPIDIIKRIKEIS